MTLRWLEAEPSVRTAVEAWLARNDGTVLRDNPRRRIVRVEGGAAGDLLVKHFRVTTGRHALRERWKSRIGRSPAAREYAALRALHAAGVPVPEPLGLAQLGDGDRLVILRWVEGHSWEELASQDPASQRAAATALGRAVARLQAAGYAHGDLHRGNLLFAAAGPVLLDLQHARRTGSRRAHLADLGHLDYSLWGYARLGQRVRVRAAAQSLARPFDATARAALRASGRAAEARAYEHGRSRTRRALRPGRRFAALQLGSARGLRVRDVSERDVAAALDNHAAALGSSREPDAKNVWKDDGRSRITCVRAGDRTVVVKEVLPRGWGRRLADIWRGSPARRAWRGGHGLLARGVGAASPLAFVEQRRLGVPVASLVILEDLSPLPDALTACASDGAGVAAALRDLLFHLHLRGIEHGDLKSTHVHILGSGDTARPRLLDLEGVRFPRRLSDARRIEALAELNASLPDRFPATRRRRLFEGYSAALPFESPRRDVLRTIAALSLARRHRWSGTDCECARSAGPRASSGSR